MFTFEKIIFLLLVATLFGSSTELKIYIAICDEIPEEIIPDLKKYIEKIYCMKTEVINIPLDLQKAYNKKRNQYHATILLNEIQKKSPKDAFRLLALIDKDLYTEGLNFIFGQAYGKFCIVSINRFKPCLWKNKKQEMEILFSRVLKTSIHEIGHTFGLPHCDNPKCVMFFSNWIGDTDRKSHEFCRMCSDKLGMYFKKMERNLKVEELE